jgi:hypothetical protein
MVSMLSPNRFTSSALTSSWCVPFNFSPTWFSWTFLMAYYKAKSFVHTNILFLLVISDTQITVKGK